LDTPHAQLRRIGLSNNKAAYIKNVATFALEEGITLKHLNRLSDEEVITYLTRIKGVGRWTVEMLMIFHLDRPDVLSKDDLIIQQSIIQLYGLQDLNKKALSAKIEALAEPWRPWCSYACRYLWRWNDARKKAMLAKVPVKK
jgi:DNA-3-methyladenine glycosylase II